MNPIETSCRYQNPYTLANCGANASEPCRDAGGHVMEGFHAERIEDAAAASGGTADPKAEKGIEAWMDDKLF